MNIAAVLNCSVTDGGGFNQALNAVVQMSRLCEGRYEYVVYTSFRENINYLAKLGISAKHYKIGLIDRWVAFTATNQLLRIVQKLVRRIGNFEKKLLSNNTDLVYFVTPTTHCLSLQKLNYIATVWDLCHRDAPEFPEVREYNEFLSREYLYNHTLSQALLIICDSSKLVNSLAHRYGIDQNRLLAMPFSEAPLIEKKLGLSTSMIMKKYNLKEGYYFYPAQFWSHKNHVRILQAQKILVEQGMNPRLVLCGGDKGNLKHVKSTINDLNLNTHVDIIGFVPIEDIVGLYKGACAVVMPSYFGPTNLPPLEAWKLGVPLIYSSLHDQQAGDAGILANPDSAEDWADAMRKVLEPETKQKLIDNGRKRLMQLEEERSDAESAMSQCLYIFNKRLECWKVQ